MVEGIEEQGERGKEGRHKNALFYMDNGMVALSDLQWLQGAFSILVDPFDRVGLQTNISKTFGIVCRLLQAAGTQSRVAFRRQMMEESPYNRYWQKGRVQRKECGEEMAPGSMAGHMRM